MTTETITSGPRGSLSMTISPTDLLSVLPLNILDHFPKLSRAQAGHIRHFYNLATLHDGEWRHMGGVDPGQESFEAYRYQIATMAYAASVTHYHRLPVLRSVFRDLLERLISKMMRRDVWGYWYLTCQSGVFLDPGIEELRKPWPDPVTRENIMFSGHLLLMVSLHAMLFDSDKYDQPGALTFDWNPIFWGMGPEKFPYNRTSLQKAILEDMERQNWIGVCCEPNCVFIVCNQFPLIAVRYNDIRNGTNVIDCVLKKYTAAWKSKNVLTENGTKFPLFYRVKQDAFVPNTNDLALDAWALAYMNSWNSEFVHSVYANYVRGFYTKFADGRVNLNSPVHAKHLLSLQSNDNRGSIFNDDHTVSAELFSEAHQQIQTLQTGLTTVGGGVTPMGSTSTPIGFGLVTQMISELTSGPDDGKENYVLEGLLQHADTFLNPTWERGGLFYPRSDAATYDTEGNWTGMDPFTGNAGIAYGRLNVRNGQKKMWEDPWSKTTHHATHPFVEGADLGTGVDFLRGGWREDMGVMAITMRTWDESEKRIELTIHNLPDGAYGVYLSGLPVRKQPVNKGDVIPINVQVSGTELDVIVIKQ